MNLSDSELNKIQELAGLFLTPDEIAVSMDLDIVSFEKLLKNTKSKAYLAYLKGKTESKIAIRQNVIKMAKHGSPQAEELAERYISEQNRKDRKHGR